MQNLSELNNLVLLEIISGMAATYYLYDQLFISPHLLGGLGIVAIAAVAAALVPWLQNLLRKYNHQRFEVILLRSVTD